MSVKGGISAYLLFQEGTLHCYFVAGLPVYYMFERGYILHTFDRGRLEVVLVLHSPLAKVLLRSVNSIMVSLSKSVSVVVLSARESGTTMRMP